MNIFEANKRFKASFGGILWCIFSRDVIGARKRGSWNRLGSIVPNLPLEVQSCFISTRCLCLYLLLPMFTIVCLAPSYEVVGTFLQISTESRYWLSQRTTCLLCTICFSCVPTSGRRLRSQWCCWESFPMWVVHDYWRLTSAPSSKRNMSLLKPMIVFHLLILNEEHLFHCIWMCSDTMCCIGPIEWYRFWRINLSLWVNSS